MAIMVGKNTVLLDNPRLTTRLAEGPNPLRIFIDKNLGVPADFNIYSAEAPTMVFNAERSEKRGHITLVKIDFDQNVLEQISAHLYSMGIQSVMVEGGATLLSHFIAQKMYDEVQVFVNKDLLLSHGLRAPRIDPRS
jgi:diaminohydroxyphosphoribosylaminopyrimidine deaminase / 5-amino-6-(5-phosphoribosylamino)uracil reductase